MRKTKEPLIGSCARQLWLEVARLGGSSAGGEEQIGEQFVLVAYVFTLPSASSFDAPYQLIWTPFALTPNFLVALSNMEP